MLNRRGGKGESKHEECDQSHPSPSRTDLRPSGNYGMAHPGDAEQDCPDEPSDPKKYPMGIRASAVSRDTRRCERGEIENTMCPPSSCPPGSRLSAVANIHAQAAIATGCISRDVSGGAIPPRKRETILKISGNPSSNEGPRYPGGIGLDSPSPAISTATATTKPAIGPAMPMSNSSARLRIGDRMR